MKTFAVLFARRLLFATLFPIKAVFVYLFFFIGMIWDLGRWLFTGKTRFLDQPWMPIFESIMEWPLPHWNRKRL